MQHEHAAEQQTPSRPTGTPKSLPYALRYASVQFTVALMSQTLARSGWRDEVGVHPGGRRGGSQTEQRAGKKVGSAGRHVRPAEPGCPGIVARAPPDALAGYAADGPSGQ